MDALEQHYVVQYNADPRGDPDLVMFLGDNAGYSRTWSAASGKIPCFRNNKGIMWCPFFRRFMVPADKLAVMGVPVNAEYCSTMSVPQLPVKDVQRQVSLLGNAMHFATATIVQFVALVCFGKAT